MMKTQFNEIQNLNCHKRCNKEERQKATKDDLCNHTVSVIDNLPVRCVGEWAEQKIYHLTQYLGIFSNGMKGKWDGNINYIEICSGPGRCINRKYGTEFNGTSLCVIEHPTFKHLKKALFFDYNQRVIDTLNKRISDKGITNAKAFLGDYNNSQEITFIIKREIQNHGLNLIFIDPTDCSLPFSLIRDLKTKLSNVDFIINIAIGTDYTRNIKGAILDPVSNSNSFSKYSKFIDNDAFFKSEEIIELAKNNSDKDLRLAFRAEFERSLRSIGFNYFNYKHIKNYYDLIFATSHKTGIEFWEKANNIQFDGQRSLNF